ncbi:hypothetical protein [Deinococcus soli (ex Cha et al. 2016)]|uniref:hypothetical protein n=1 Tax=Deinococcus soli (ex Cha et al. 2016) TaxID=1309411 RepID=UPI00166EE665|nr:hypothetical protein [Deinococcus soli (ex Cha et al. 2016)]GGB84649.1 hypothetical protein GCM10008019_45800 [Deinococcus soli (ex Cha et al. 2016)]
MSEVPPRNALNLWKNGPVALALEGADGQARMLGANNPLPMSDARPPVTDALYAPSGTGAASALPTSAVLVELTAVGSDLWFRFGGAGLAAVSAPSGALSSGAPRFLPLGSSILVDVRTATRYAVLGSGAFVLGWWV